MDFDSILSILFILAFFVLPTLIKQVQARKKKNETPETKVKKPSLFGKLGDRFQQMIRELEEQSRQQRQEVTEEESVWEQLADDEARTPLTDTDYDHSDLKIENPVSKAQIIPDIPISNRERRVSPEKKQKSGRNVCSTASHKNRFRKNALRNAIVWSEILSKPIALRDE